MAHQKPDRAYMDRLVAQLHKNPAAIEPRKLLMQQYVLCGLFAQAGEQAMHILTMDPTNTEAKDVRDLEQGHKALKKTADILWRETNLLRDLKGMQASDFSDLVSSFAALAKGVEVQDNAGPAQSGTRLVNTKPAYGREASGQLQVQAIASQKSKARTQQPARDIPRIEAAGNTSIARKDGRTNAANNTIAVKTQKSARGVAADIAAAYKTNTVTALDIAFKDLKDEIERKNRDPSNDREADRQASLRRMETFKFLLPSKLRHIADAAQMHVEHEVLHRKYTNTETCGLEPVSEIPRANFWVSEDAYAWDMEELATAITSNRGIMRNPLSRLMFHARDVRAIIQHPLGKHLAAMQVDQSELRQGVRDETIEKLDKLARKLLDDETEDFAPSHRAVEAFAAYLATLPVAEQKAIDELWVPAVDSHTGMQFDMTVGQAVKDAQSNLVCFHKTGDLLRQAVAYLDGGENYYAGY